MKYALIFIFSMALIIPGIVFLEYYTPQNSMKSISITLPTAPQYIANYTQNQLSYFKSNGGDALVLKWNPPAIYQGATITSFNVYRGVTQGFETYLGSASPSQFAFVDTTIAANQTYWYYVTAIFSDNTVGLIAPEIAIQN